MTADRVQRNKKITTLKLLVYKVLISGFAPNDIIFIFAS